MKIGILGGSGLYELEGLENIGQTAVNTPFGRTSDDITSGTLDGKEVMFIPRHGRGHRLLPSEVPFRANVWALKSLGVTHLISVSAVGSLQEEIEPGHLVFPDQFIDRTFMRPSTFFGGGVVAHVQFGDPVCGHLREELCRSAAELGIRHHPRGTYICMEGPAFSTRAESFMYRSWGGTIIGMTNIQEAKLAREAEMCFATIALATDYDCWHESEEEVSVEAVLEVMRSNIATSKKLLSKVIRSIDEERDCPCHSAMQYAILTARDQISPTARKNLEPIIGKYVND
ncbi:MAG: S-methyl-5'-thioadenosine phosphorylase [Deltaproteobacteria bacterium]|nr:S-methyl-5'-thioadenosine phosphorylase [Deltaproteobacteria bacterium]